MSAKYSTRNFFRNVPNALLFEYFKRQNILQKYDFSHVTENKIDPIFKAWKELSDEQIRKMEIDFQNIYKMGCAGGIKALIDEAGWHNIDEDIVALLEEHKGHLAKAFWIFLERSQYWNGGVYFLRADKVAKNRWQEWYINTQIPATLGDTDIKALEKHLTTFFYNKQGRGKNCKVEVYKRGELDYFFAYPEDFSESSMEWKGTQLESITRTPAFEVIFVYSQKNQKISLYMTGAAKEKVEVRSIFTDTILGIYGGDFVQQKQVYELQSLKNKKLKFVYSPNTGIEKVIIKKLRVKLKGMDGRITIESFSDQNPLLVSELKEKIEQIIPESTMEVDYAQITVFFADDPSLPSQSKTRTFELSANSANSLDHEGRDAIIRQMLMDSGLDSKLIKK